MTRKSIRTKRGKVPHFRLLDLKFLVSVFIKFV